jgi:hypothetical protein
MLHAIITEAISKIGMMHITRRNRLGNISNESGLKSLLEYAPCCGQVAGGRWAGVVAAMVKANTKKKKVAFRSLKQAYSTSVASLTRLT